MKTLTNVLLIATVNLININCAMAEDVEYLYYDESSNTEDDTHSILEDDPILTFEDTTDSSNNVTEPEHDLHTLIDPLADDPNDAGRTCENRARKNKNYCKENTLPNSDGSIDCDYQFEVDMLDCNCIKWGNFALYCRQQCFAELEICQMWIDASGRKCEKNEDQNVDCGQEFFDQDIACLKSFEYCQQTRGRKPQRLQQANDPSETA